MYKKPQLDNPSEITLRFWVPVYNLQGFGQAEEDRRRRAE